MLGIDPMVMTHRLNVDHTYRPVKQKKRSSTPECQKAIMEELDKLLKVEFIREVSYPDGIANVVFVKKANRKW